MLRPRMLPVGIVRLTVNTESEPSCTEPTKRELPPTVTAPLVVVAAADRGPATFTCDADMPVADVTALAAIRPVTATLLTCRAPGAKTVFSARPT